MREKMALLRRFFTSVGWQKQGGRLLSLTNARRQSTTTASKSIEENANGILTSGVRLAELPVTTKLRISDEQVVVDRLALDGLDEAFRLVESAAKRRDNVGIDEFPSLKDFGDHVTRTSAFTLRNPGSGAMNALIMLSPCLAARTILPCLASLQVISSERFSRDSTWKDCAQLGVDIARQLPVRYSACVTEVFLSCVDRVVALRKQGFVICACVPSAGRLAPETADNTTVLSPSYLMYKEFDPAVTTRASVSELIETTKDLSGTSSKDEDDPTLSFSSPPISFLPADYFLSPTSISCRFRQLRKEEFNQYYEFFLSSGKADEGFSVEEFPTKRLFWQNFRHNHNFVIEDTKTGKWVAVGCLGPSLFSRSKSSGLADGSLIIAPEFRNFGLGKVLLGILLDVARKLGYTYLYSDTPVYDTAALYISFKYLSFTGTLPRAIYSPKHGWSDVILVCAELKKLAKL